MTFELSPIIGSTFGGYQFKVKHCDSEVLKRVKKELMEAMRDRGYNLDVKHGVMER